MEEVLKISYDEFETPYVSARSLYEEFGIKKRFSEWFKVNSQGFAENEDFTSVLSGTVVNNGAHRDIQDYSLSVDMAKHFCLMSKTEKGKQCRQYLIDLEKAWNTPEQIMARALKVADNTIHKLQSVIEEQKPLVDFANKVSDSSSLIDIGKMAKLLQDENINIGRNRLFKWLRTNNILMDDNVPYQRYIDGGYFQIKEKIFNTPYGTKIGTTTYVTGKGQIYITEKLRKKFGEVS